MSSYDKPISNVDEECIKNCSPLESLQGIHDSYHSYYDNAYLLKKIFIWLDNFLSDTCVSMVFLQLMHLQWSSKAKKLVVTMKTCGCLILLSQNFILK